MGLSLFLISLSLSLIKSFEFNLIEFSKEVSAILINGGGINIITTKALKAVGLIVFTMSTKRETNDWVEPINNSN